MSSFKTANGTTWVIQEPAPDVDLSKIVSIIIRRFQHKDTEYIIEACAYLSFPLKVFYNLQVKNQNDVVSGANPYRDFRMLKNILKKQPIELDQYKVFERKLHRKVVERKLELYNEQKNQTENNANAIISTCGNRQLKCTSERIHRYLSVPGNKNEMTESQITLLNIAERYFYNAEDFDEEQMRQIGEWCIRLTNILDRKTSYPMKNYYISLNKMTSYFTTCMEKKKHLDVRPYNTLDATRRLALSLITDKLYRQSMLMTKWESEYLYGDNSSQDTIVTNGYKRLGTVEILTTNQNSEDNYSGGILGVYARGDNEIYEGFFLSGTGGKIDVDFLF